MTKNEILYNKAMAAIRELFDDLSVSQEDAKENLETIIVEIEIMISTLKT